MKILVYPLRKVRLSSQLNSCQNGCGSPELLLEHIKRSDKTQHSNKWAQKLHSICYTIMGRSICKTMTGRSIFNTMTGRGQLTFWSSQPREHRHWYCQWWCVAVRDAHYGAAVTIL